MQIAFKMQESFRKLLVKLTKSSDSNHVVSELPVKKNQQPELFLVV